ncbi:hypothetical protein ACWENQ_45550 [Nonomuraea sp. NPDC004354]
MHGEHAEPESQRRWPYEGPPPSFGQATAAPPRLQARYAQPTPPGNCGTAAVRDVWERHPRAVLLGALAALVAVGLWSSSWDAQPPAPATAVPEAAPHRAQEIPNRPPSTTARRTPADETRELDQGDHVHGQDAARPEHARQRPAAGGRGRADRPTADSPGRTRVTAPARPAPRPGRATQAPKRRDLVSRQCDALFPPQKPAYALRNRVCHQMYG